MLQFTTLAAINTRLKQRIQLGGVQSAFGKSVIDNPDAEYIANQVESRVINALQIIPNIQEKLNIPSAKPAIASAVEKLVICDILAPNYTGVEPSDEGGYIRSEFCLQGQKELDDFIAIYSSIGTTIGAVNRVPVVGMRTGGTIVDF